ncbi:capsid protein [Delitschia confertaspora partitivirus 1]|nr:capsid protein [Delitschia confertaspora partitivirus 1]
MTSHAGKAEPSNTEGGDSAPPSDKTKTSKATSSRKGGGGKGGSKGPSSKPKAESSTSKQTPGFADGNAVLNNYGLSISGYRERVLSPFKTEKFFHMVSTSYQRLLSVKPSLTERFTYDEFLHCSALQVYQRIEHVKFDALGIKPPAPLRIPLPRNLRVFQPLWSILANIGTVKDDELRVEYIPDAVLPDSDNLDSEHDVEGLLSCTLYDWNASWQSVLKARESRDTWQQRDGYTSDVDDNSSPTLSREQLIKAISDRKQRLKVVEYALENDVAEIVSDRVYLYPKFSIKDKQAAVAGGKKESDFFLLDDEWYDTSLTEDALKARPAYKTPAQYMTEIDDLMAEAKNAKKVRITPRFDVVYNPSSYKISDGTVTSDPGSYGAKLHWDPQLWLDYENFVNEVAPLALFSLSMPVETTGTYAWVLPVEKRSRNNAAFCVKLPKASIPTQTWVMALLLQSSTLPLSRRSTWYTETDYLTNLPGLRQRYIQAAIKAPSPVEQFGTY